ncbi:MAG: DUF4446 family protein [Candidatus Yanofskybacteria bacterium]|nr:DUF4446 family protein [Candidatus Yanofskybacteria bacterium]
MNLFSKKNTSISDLKEAEKKIRQLEAKIEELSGELDEFKKSMKKAVIQVNVQRYNPFREIGGNQSFSVAFLDGEQTGVVLTSHYGRDANRVYAKPVKGGVSEYTLSREEQEVLREAGEEEKKAKKK